MKLAGIKMNPTMMSYFSRWILDTITIQNEEHLLEQLVLITWVKKNLRRFSFIEKWCMPLEPAVALAIMRMMEVTPILDDPYEGVVMRQVYTLIHQNYEECLKEIQRNQRRTASFAYANAK